MLPLYIVTIALDAMPWITLIYPELRKLTIPWTWHVIEGVAAPANCTSWVASIKPRLSSDGTTEHLDSLRFDPRVKIHRSECWTGGKVQMMNQPLRYVFDPVILMQIDSDEIWSAEQLAAITAALSNTEKNCAYFRCRYFVGRDIITVTPNAYGNHEAYEWHRAWRIEPGARFATHEPPALANFTEKPFTHAETAKLGLTFDHYAYATEAQVRFKAEYYSGDGNPKAALYKDALTGWRELQSHQKWPAQLERFLPWVGPEAMAERIG